MPNAAIPPHCPFCINRANIVHYLHSPSCSLILSCFPLSSRHYCSLLLEFLPHGACHPCQSHALYCPTYSHWLQLLSFQSSGETFWLLCILADLLSCAHSLMPAFSEWCFFLQSPSVSFSGSISWFG